MSREVTPARARADHRASPLSQSPRPVPAAVARAGVMALVLGAAMVAGVGALGGMPRAERLRPARASGGPDGEALYDRGTRAYQEGRWDEARRAFEQVLAAHPGHLRAHDFLDRLDAVARESAFLARAEEALVSGQVQVARRHAAEVPPHSPLFAQAEAMLRGLRRGRPTAFRAEPWIQEPDVDLRSVLQQAEALYREGRFEQAAARARELAAEAEGGARRELLRWAQLCSELGAVYASLPDERLGGAALARATRALRLDRPLGGAHTRTLRPRVVEAYLGLIQAEWERGDPVAACARWVEGRAFEVRESAWRGWPQRCRARAAAELSRARELETSQPDRAQLRYQAAAQMLPTEAVHRQAAEAAITRLSSARSGARAR